MTDSKPVEDLHQRLAAYMETNQLRSTNQRRAVTDLFFNSREHLSIEELLTLVRTREPKVGYATVYRTLKMLKQAGLAYERHFGDGISRYEVAHTGEHHDHLICVECGLIVEFEDEEIEELQENLAEKHGFTLTRHVHELYGTCTNARACKARQRK